MALPAWPAALPSCHILTDHEIEIGDGIIRTQMESGVARTRVRARDPLASFPLRYRMTASQVDIYRSWRRTRAASGSGWFITKVATGGAEYRSVIARETGPPRLRAIGSTANWFVTIPIEYRDEVSTDEQTLDVIVLYGENGVQDAAAIIGGLDIRPALDAWNAAV